jgi:hypothetical protein
MAYLSDRLRLDGVRAGPAQRPTADAEAPAHVPVSRRPVAARAALATAGHAR